MAAMLALPPLRRPEATCIRHFARYCIGGMPRRSAKRSASAERESPTSLARSSIVQSCAGFACISDKALPRTTPELNGEVSRVSADTIQDQRTGGSYFSVQITLPEEEVARLGVIKLVPGMPVEAFIQTGERTMLSYLVKPIMDQAYRAFREK
jgi:hypothetical protein